MNDLIGFSKKGYVETRNFENSPLPIWFTPSMTKRKGSIFLVNKHKDTELLFIIDGSMEIHLDNDTFIAESGDVVVVNSNVLHNIIPKTDHVTYHCLIIDRNFMTSHNLPVGDVHIKEVIRENSLFEKLNQLKKLIETHSIYQSAKVHALLLDMLVYLMESHGGKKQISTAAQNSLMCVELGIKYINNNFKSQISLCEIANHTGYSKFYFCRMFKETTGYTVATYINMQRIKHAQLLLETTELSVCEIAYQCGFKSVSYFSQTYKKYTGNSPSAR